MKPRRAQEDHTHAYALEPRNWLPDGFALEAVEFGCVGAPTTVIPASAGSDDVTNYARFYLNSDDTTAWSVGGTYEVQLANLDFGNSRTTGFRQRTVFGTDQDWDVCQAWHVGTVGSGAWNSGEIQNHFFCAEPAGDPSDPTPPSTGWDDGGAPLLGDAGGTYWSNVSVTETSSTSWTLNFDRDALTYGAMYVLLLDNGVAFSHNYVSGSEAAGTGKTKVLTAPAGTTITGVWAAVRHAPVVAAEPWVQPNGGTRWGAVNYNQSASWASVVTSATNWTDVVQYGSGVPAATYPCPSFVGVRAFPPPHGETDSFFEFHAYDGTITGGTVGDWPWWAPGGAEGGIANRGTGGTSGLGFRQTSTIKAVPGHVYSLVMICPEGGTSSDWTLRLKDVTAGVTETVTVPAADIVAEYTGYGYLTTLAASSLSSSLNPRLHFIDARCDMPAWETG